LRVRAALRAASARRRSASRSLRQRVCAAFCAASVRAGLLRFPAPFAAVLAAARPDVLRPPAFFAGAFFAEDIRVEPFFAELFVPEPFFAIGNLSWSPLNVRRGSGCATAPITSAFRE
jgi:hypothetical protein